MDIKFNVKSVRVLVSSSIPHWRKEETKMPPKSMLSLTILQQLAIAVLLHSYSKSE